MFSETMEKINDDQDKLKMGDTNISLDEKGTREATEGKNQQNNAEIQKKNEDNYNDLVSVGKIDNITEGDLGDIGDILSTFENSPLLSDAQNTSIRQALAFANGSYTVGKEEDKDTTENNIENLGEDMVA